MFARLASVALAAVLSVGASAAAAAEPIRVILVGDSTMQAGSGYGGALCARFAPEVECLNRGRGGRSSKSYRVEGAWDETIAIAKDGKFKTTYVLIQMGHNDGSPRPERHTELPEYKANMARFVEEAREAGATPILITPVTDRRFVDGVLQPGMKPWADLTAQVAAEENAALVDLYKLSYDKVQAMGAMGAAYLAPTPPPEIVIDGARAGNTPGGLTPPAPPAPAAPDAAAPSAARGPGYDYVHIGPTGAPIFAGLVVDELKTKVPELAPYIIEAK